jgi:hypothetical protein
MSITNKPMIQNTLRRESIFIILFSIFGICNLNSQSYAYTSAIGEFDNILHPHSKFSAIFGGCSYNIEPNGRVTKYYKDKPDSVVFQLDVNKYCLIEYIEVCEGRNSLLILFTDTDHESSGSSLTKYKKTNLNKEWTLSGLGFNLSPMTIHNDFVYISSMGNILKADLDSGKVAFQFADLYDRVTYAFNSFSEIQFNMDTVIFLSKNWYSGRLDKIFVNDKTNKLISIEK